MTKTLKEKIRIEDVNLHYGTYHALKNVNLFLPEKAITLKVRGKAYFPMQ